MALPYAAMCRRLTVGSVDLFRTCNSHRNIAWRYPLLWRTRNTSEKSVTLEAVCLQSNGKNSAVGACTPLSVHAPIYFSHLQTVVHSPDQGLGLLCFLVGRCCTHRPIVYVKSAAMTRKWLTSALYGEPQAASLLCEWSLSNARSRGKRK